MIITDINLLRQKSAPATMEEGNQILDRLREELKTVAGLGLAAPQIGILKSVCLVKLHDQPEIAMINPVIVNQYDPVISPGEGCLSFPGIKMNTERFDHVVVKDDLHPDGFVSEGQEAVAVQHEVDHCSGILFMDHKAQVKKASRNDPCPCGSGKKYKKCCLLKEPRRKV